LRDGKFYSGPSPPGHAGQLPEQRQSGLDSLDLEAAYGLLVLVFQEDVGPDVYKGFKIKSAIATTVLACNDPDEFGVLDWRAPKGLKRIERPIERGRGETLQFLVRVRELRDLVRGFRSNVTARNIDQGLWFIGGRQA